MLARSREVEIVRRDDACEIRRCDALVPVAASRFDGLAEKVAGIGTAQARSTHLDKTGLAVYSTATST